MNESVQECEFCKIAAGYAPARVVCSGEDTLAFFPLKPITPGHTLVIPKVHIKDIWSLDPIMATTITKSVLTMAQALKTSLHPDGLNIINSAGEAASQTIFHLHVHLVPRWQRDHIGNIWPPSKPWSEEIVNETADLLRAACTGLA